MESDNSNKSKVEDNRFKIDPKEYQNIHPKGHYDFSKRLPNEVFRGGLTRRALIFYLIAALSAWGVAKQGLHYKHLFIEPFYVFLFGYLPIIMALIIVISLALALAYGYTTTLELSEKHLHYRDFINELGSRWEKLHITFHREGFFPYMIISDDEKLVRVYRFMFPKYDRMFEYIYIARQKVGKPVF